jgi:F0F1-type ATP synthase assembly protein I
MIWTFVFMIVVFGILGFLMNFLSVRKQRSEKITQEEERAKNNFWWGG